MYIPGSRVGCQPVAPVEFGRPVSLALAGRSAASHRAWATVAREAEPARPGWDLTVGRRTAWAMDRGTLQASAQGAPDLPPPAA